MFQQSILAIVMCFDIFILFKIFLKIYQTSIICPSRALYYKIAPYLSEYSLLNNHKNRFQPMKPVGRLPWFASFRPGTSCVCDGFSIVTSLLYGFKQSSMSEADHYHSKLQLLAARCEKIAQRNTKAQDRIRHVKKEIKHLKCFKRYLIRIFRTNFC